MIRPSAAARTLEMPRVFLAPRQVEHSGDLRSVAEKHGVATPHLAVLARVELDEIGAVVAGVADADGDREHRLGDGQHALGAARAPLREHEPGQVGPGLGCRGDVLGARQPAHLDERAREELGELRRGIRGAHERRADEDRVRAGQLGGGALRARLDPALGDHDAIRGRSRRRARAAPARSIEKVARSRALIPITGASRPYGARELVRVVRLDEGVEAEVARGVEQAPRRLVVEVAQDEERGVGSGLARRPQVVLCREEPLREQRQPRGGARCAQVVPGARRTARRRGSRPRPRRLARRTQRAPPGSASGRRSPADGERRFTSAMPWRPGRAESVPEAPHQRVLSRERRRLLEPLARGARVDRLACELEALARARRRARPRPRRPRR